MRQASSSNVIRATRAAAWMPVAGLAPAQARMRVAMPRCSSQAAAWSGFLARLRPQPVIDDQAQDGAGACARPFGGEQRQRHAVRPARHGDG